jgi:hypothetical protein
MAVKSSRSLEALAEQEDGGGDEGDSDSRITARTAIYLISAHRLTLPIRNKKSNYYTMAGPEAPDRD